MKHHKYSLIAIISILLVCVSLSGSQSMRLKVVGSHKPYISETMTNKLISVALAGMRGSKHWSHFVPNQEVLVVYNPQGCRFLGITNSFWDVEFTHRNWSEYHIGGGVSVKLDANSFKVLSVLGTK